MARPPTELTQLYRPLANIPIALAGTGLLNLVLIAADLGAFGGPPHHPTGRTVLAATIGDGLLIASIIAAAATYRTRHNRTAARRCLLAFLALAAGIAALLLIPDSTAGRNPIEAAVTEGRVRFSLLCDRATGVLLASERADPGVQDAYTLDRRDNDTRQTA